MRTTARPVRTRARARDPERRTRTILAAAQAMMPARPEGLTVTTVARRAGVNRGTATSTSRPASVWLRRCSIASAAA